VRPPPPILISPFAVQKKKARPFDPPRRDTPGQHLFLLQEKKLEIPASIFKKYSLTESNRHTLPAPFER
jgi:hypothetical protein